MRCALTRVHSSQEDYINSPSFKQKTEALAKQRYYMHGHITEEESEGALPEKFVPDPFFVARDFKKFLAGENEEGINLMDATAHDTTYEEYLRRAPLTVPRWVTEKQ
jgi:hypothetical protein